MYGSSANYVPNHRSKISRDDTHSECMARLLNHWVSWPFVRDGKTLAAATRCWWWWQSQRMQLFAHSPTCTNSVLISFRRKETAVILSLQQSSICVNTHTRPKSPSGSRKAYCVISLTLALPPDSPRSRRAQRNEVT